MDQRFATFDIQQTASEIPHEIHQSLFSIALHGYDPKDVSFWYQHVLQTLRRMNTDTTQPAATGMTTAGLVADDTLNAHYPEFFDTGSAARRATMATIDSCMSPATKPHAVPSTEMPPVDGDYNPNGIYAVSTQDSTSQAYNTPQSYQTYATTPQQVDSTPEPPQNHTYLTGWSPAPSSAAEQDMYAVTAPGSLSNGNLLAFAGEPTTVAPTYPWFHTQDMSSMHSRNHSQQSHLSQQSLPGQQMPPLPQQPYLSPDYNTQLSGTTMPVLVPYASSAGSGNYTKAAAIPTGPGASLYQSGAGFFPIIHVSSSRRRRKALQKGVKKMVQPLKGRRQQSV